MQPANTKSPNNLYARLLEISEAQRLNLRLMELASFNEFDGPGVVRDLLNNQDLWRACVMDREPGLDRMNLIKLRDLADERVLGHKCEIWSVDTLFIVPVLGEEAKLEKLAGTWKADEIAWIKEDPAGNMMGGYPGFRKTKILRVWWD